MGPQQSLRFQDFSGKFPALLAAGCSVYWFEDPRGLLGGGTRLATSWRVVRWISLGRRVLGAQRLGSLLVCFMLWQFPGSRVHQLVKSVAIPFPQAMAQLAA